MGAARLIGGQEGKRMDRRSSERGFMVRCVATVGMSARGGDGAAFGQTAGVEFVGVDETAGDDAVGRVGGVAREAATVAAVLMGRRSSRHGEKSLIFH